VGILRRIFRSKPKSESIRPPGVIPLVPPRKTKGQEKESEQDFVRRAVANCKGVSINEVTDDMVIGKEAGTVCMNLVFALGKPLAMDISSTVGDVIKQLQSK
jgi:hypothetical protein